MTNRRFSRRRLRRHLRLYISGGVIALIVLAAVFGPLLSPYDPSALDVTAILKAPSAAHLLGTDSFGRDILTRLMLGARPSLTIAVGATALALVAGTILGLIAGFARGVFEQIIMRSIDILLTFPPIVLAMGVIGFLGSGVVNLIVVIGVLYIPTFARIAFGSTLQVREIGYVDAALALGVKAPGVLRKHILPNILAPLIVQASLVMAASILLESGLSFLGLGVTPPTPSWGVMVGDARHYMTQAPFYVLWPSLALAITILAINTFGDALRDVLDPNL